MPKQELVSIDRDILHHLPIPCRACGYWEAGEKVGPGAKIADGAAKESWFSRTLVEWGGCGKAVVLKSEVLAFCQYGPPAYFPQLKFAPRGWLSDNAVFIACLYVRPGWRGRGLGKQLLLAVEPELYRRGYRTIETLGRRAPARNPSGWTEFYLNQGFQLVKEKGALSWLRLDLRTAVRRQYGLDEIFNKLPKLIKSGRIGEKLPIPS